MISTEHFGKSLAIIFGGVAALVVGSIICGQQPKKAINPSQKQTAVVEQFNKSCKLNSACDVDAVEKPSRVKGMKP